MSALPNQPPVPISELTEGIIRLSSGHSCALLLLAVWNHRSSVFRLSELAASSRCDVPQLKRELAALVQRGIADVTYFATSESPKTEVCVELKYADWKSLPDYIGERR
jgi:hypothetical protein